MSLVRSRSGTCTVGPIFVTRIIPSPPSNTTTTTTAVTVPAPAPVYITTTPITPTPGKFVAFVDGLWSVVALALTWFGALLPLHTWLKCGGICGGLVTLLLICTGAKAGSTEAVRAVGDAAAHAARSTINSDTLGFTTIGRSVSTVHCYAFGKYCASSYATYTDTKTGDKYLGSPFWQHIIGQDRSLVFTEGLSQAAIAMSSHDMANLATMSHRQVSTDISALRELAASSAIGSDELERKYTRSSLKKVAKLSEEAIRSVVNVASHADGTLTWFKGQVHNFIVDSQRLPTPSPQKVLRVKSVLDQLHAALGRLIVAIDKALLNMERVDIAYGTFSESLEDIKVTYEREYGRFPMWLTVLEKAASALHNDLVLSRLGDINHVLRNITKAKRAIKTMSEIADGLRATRQRMEDMRDKIGQLRESIVGARDQHSTAEQIETMYQPLFEAWKTLEKTCRDANTARDSPDVLLAVLANKWWPF